jgi:hypothetical protein
MRLETVLLLAAVAGIAAWRSYRMWKGMAYHYRRYRYYSEQKKQAANTTKFRF